MAAPTSGPYGTTSTIVSATGADASPLTSTSTNFTGSGHDPFRRVSNQIKSGALNSGQSYFSTLGATVGPDCELWGQVVHDGANGNYLDFVLRLTSPDSGAGGSESFYEGEIDFLAASPHNIAIWKNSLGTATQVASGTLAIVDGDYWAVAVHQSGGNPVIEIFHWDNVSSWGTAVLSYTDTTATAALKGQGYLGLEGAGSATFALGDIMGGTIPSGGAGSWPVSLPGVNGVLPIIGTLEVGQTITLDQFNKGAPAFEDFAWWTGFQVGAWAGDPTGFTYQWYRDHHNDSQFDILIGGETGVSHLLTDADDGCQMAIVVAATNAVGTVGAIVATGLIVQPIPVNTVRPTVTGAAKVGQILNANAGTWLHMGGYNPVLSYQWQRADPNTAFPSTSVLDSFDRANTGPPPSANWTDGSFDGSTDGLKVVANQLAPGTSGDGYGGAYWSAGTFVPDCEVYATWISGGVNADDWLYLRVTNPGPTPNGYALEYDRTNTRLVILKDVAGTSSSILSIPGITLASGDVYGLRAVGSTLTAYVNGVAVGSVTDTTYSTAGYLGVSIKRGDTIDNFGGGEFQWTNIGDATSSSYLVDQSVAGYELRVNVIGSNTGGFDSASSLPTAPVTGATFPVGPTVERSRDPEQVQVTLVAGRTIRNLKVIANSAIWTTAAVGGFADCSFGLEGWWPAEKIPYLSMVRVTYGTMVLWEGRVEDLRYTVSDGQLRTTVTCFGLRRLLDDISVQRVWLKRDLNWGSVPVAPGGIIGNSALGITRSPANSLVLNSGNYDPTDATKSGVQVVGGGVAIPQNYGDMLQCQLNGVALTRLMFTLAFVGANTGAGKLVGYYQAQNPADSTGSGQDQGRLTAAGATDIALGANRSIIRLGSYNDSAFGTPGPITPTAGDFVQYSSIRVLGSTLTESVAGGIYGGALLRDLISLIPGLTAGVIEDGSDYAIQQLTADVRRYASDVASEIVGYYAREWAVWESEMPGEGRFDWGTPALNEPQWFVAIRDCIELEIDTSVEGTPSTTYVLYTDAASDLADQQSATSTDQRNPFVKAGKTKDELVSPGFPMVANTGQQLASVQAAADGTFPTATGTLTLPARALIKSSHDGPHPAFAIRSGQNILIVDAPKTDPFQVGRDGQTLFHIVDTETDLAAGTVKLTLDGYTSRIDVINARLADATRVLTG